MLSGWNVFHLRLRLFLVTYGRNYWDSTQLAGRRFVIAGPSLIGLKRSIYYSTETVRFTTIAVCFYYHIFALYSPADPRLV